MKTELSAPSDITSTDTNLNIETIHLSHLPPSISVHAVLFHSVTNAAFLRSQLLQGNPSFEYSFVDASLLLSRRHALAAVFRAVNDFVCGRLSSRNVHSEIVFGLSPNNNIGEAFRRFGVQDDTTNLLVFKVGVGDNDGNGNDPEREREKIKKHLGENVKGTPVPFDDEHLAGMTDVKKVRKTYKLGGGGGGGGGDKADRIDDEERQDMEVQVLGLMALRGTAR